MIAVDVDKQICVRRILRDMAVALEVRSRFISNTRMFSILITAETLKAQAFKCTH